MIGSKIKSIRQSKGISQLSLSKQLNISNTTLSQYENDKRVPSLDILTNIADKLDVTIDEILGRDQETPIHNFEKEIKDTIDIANSINIKLNKSILKDNNPNNWDDVYTIFKQVDTISVELKKLEDICLKLKKIDKMYSELKDKK